ncbi:MAG: glycosyl hydrolase, partial [Muriicola sp.]
QDNDLVAATAGRSFWILDDVGALQSAPISSATIAMVQPKDTYLLFGGSTDKPVPGLGQNPKQGVTVDYYLGQKADSTELILEVLQNNEVIRSYSSKKPEEFSSWPGGPSKPEVLPAKQGYNRFTWDFRKESLPAVDKVFVYGNYEGSRVAPGTYGLRLTLGEAVSETSVGVLPNPKVEASEADYLEQQQMLNQIAATITAMHVAVNQMRSAKNQLTAYEKLLKENTAAEELVSKGKALLERINTWEEQLIQPKQKTFQDVINFHNQLNAEFMELRSYVDAAEPKVTQGAKERMSDLMAQWNRFDQEKNAIVATEMNAYNTLYKSLNLPAIILDK